MPARAINAFTGVTYDPASKRLFVDGKTDVEQFTATRIDVVVVDAANEERRLEGFLTGPKEGDPIPNPWNVPLDLDDGDSFTNADEVNLAGLATSATGETFLWSAAGPSLAIPVRISLKS